MRGPLNVKQFLTEVVSRLDKHSTQQLTTKMSVHNKLSPHIPSDMSLSRLDVSSKLCGAPICCSTCASTGVRCDTDSMHENTHAVE